MKISDVLRKIADLSDATESSAFTGELTPVRLPDTPEAQEDIVVTSPEPDSADSASTLKLNTTIAAPATDEMPSEPLWIPPGQQTLELQKQQGGKQSVVINQIVKSDNGPDTDPSDGVFANVSDDEEGRAPDESIYAANALDSGWEGDDTDKLAGTGEQPEVQDADDDGHGRMLDLIRKLTQA